jgi:glycosyltransferase involved in cell wall biosynthesis
VRWLAFGTYDSRRHPRVGVLIEGLRAAGDEVTEVNAPLALSTAGRVALVRQPWRLPGFAADLAGCWWRLVRQVRTRRRTPGYRPPDAVLVGYLGHFDVRLARRLFPGTPIVLDHLVSAAGTVRDRGLAGQGGAKAALMRAIDDGALRRADVVLVDTAENLAALPAVARDRAVVVPVGAGAAWFGAGLTAVGAGPPLRAVFVGLFTPLHGTPALGAALGLLAGDDRIEVTMVGTGQDYQECRRVAAANPRVTWLDWVDAAELPALVAGHQVSLGIFGTTPKAAKVVPTKVFQGAAAGCAIITSDTAPQRAELAGAAVHVPPGDPEAIAAALRELAGDPARLADLRAAAVTRAADRFAAATVVAPLRQRLARAGTAHTSAEAP